MKLTEALTSLLTEVASIDSIVDSIKKRKKIIIYYDGDEPGGRGLREIEPVCLGVSKANNRILRAWDMEGSSHTAYKGEQPLPGWRLFRVDKILSFKPTGEFFDSPRPNYNFDGDKSMINVIINAVFDNVVSLTDIMSKSINEIVDTTLLEMFNDMVRQYGVDYLKDVDASKAAETFRRVYQEIGRRMGRPLTAEEKKTIKPQVAKVISELQETVKNKYK